MNQTTSDLLYPNMRQSIAGQERLTSQTYPTTVACHGTPAAHPQCFDVQYLNNSYDKANSLSNQVLFQSQFNGATIIPHPNQMATFDAACHKGVFVGRLSSQAPLRYNARASASAQGETMEHPSSIVLSPSDFCTNATGSQISTRPAAKPETSLKRGVHDFGVATNQGVIGLIDDGSIGKSPGPTKYVSTISRKGGKQSNPKKPECYEVPTDEQLWFGSITSSPELRNHLRSAFHPKRWPAFCRTKGFLLPLYYKPGYGLGLINPENKSIHAGMIVGFIEHLISIGEPRNAWIHCVSFLNQMALLETTHRYNILLPVNFHITAIAPELLDLMRTDNPQKKLKTGDTSCALNMPSRATFMPADPEEGSRNQSDFKKVERKEPPSGGNSGLRHPKEKSQTELHRPALAIDMPGAGGKSPLSKGALQVRATLLELSKKVDTVLATRLEIVDGRLVYINDIE